MVKTGRFNSRVRENMGRQKALIKAGEEFGILQWEWVTMVKEKDKLKGNIRAGSRVQGWFGYEGQRGRQNVTDRV